MIYQRLLLSNVQSPSDLFMQACIDYTRREPDLKMYGSTDVKKATTEMLSVSAQSTNHTMISPTTYNYNFKLFILLTTWFAY